MKRSYLYKFCLILASLFLIIHDINAQNDGERNKILKNSLREDHFGIPFLYLQGTDYEVGYQYGYLLKDEDPSSILQAIRAIVEGRNWFSQFCLIAKRGSVATCVQGNTRDKRNRNSKGPRGV